MKQGAFSKFQLSVRWFLLISVIASSFFSSGEGVQLLPFPDSDRGGENGPRDINGTPDKSYAFSVHNLTITAAAKISSQKKVKKDASVESSATTHLAHVVDPDLIRQRGIFARRSSFLSEPDVLLPSGRAPPSTPALVS